MLFFLSHSQLPISVFLEIITQNQYHCHSMNQTLHLKRINTVEKIPKYYEEFMRLKFLTSCFGLNSSSKNIESSNLRKSLSILF